MYINYIDIDLAQLPKCRMVPKIGIFSLKKVRGVYTHNSIIPGQVYVGPYPK